MTADPSPSTRHFVKIRDDRPVAVLRLTVDPRNQTIIEEHWNPAMTAWERGHYVMEHLNHGRNDIHETDHATVTPLFPDCPA